MASAAVVEVPQGARLNALVGVDGRVLVVAVFWTEEVELEVLPGFVPDLAAVEDDAMCLCHSVYMRPTLSAGGDVGC